MNKTFFASKAVSATLIVAIQLAFAPPLPATTTPATLSGFVFAVDSRTAVAGAVVRVKDYRTGDLYTSAPTDDKGSFSVAELPPSTYGLAVEVGPGLFAAGAPLTLTPGQHRAVQVGVYATDAAPAPEEAEKEKKRYGAGFWENPLTATFFILGIAVILGFSIEQLTDDNDQELVSQSRP